MARPRRAVVLLDEPETTDAPVPAQARPPVPAEAEPAVLQRTPARQHLADAIATVRALEAEIAEASAAVSEAQEARTSTFLALQEAEDTLRQARPRERAFGDSYTPPSRPAGAFWGSAADDEEAARRDRAAAEAPPISIADAKAAVAVAQDAYDSARRLVQHHEDRAKQAADRLQWKRGAIGEAIRGVVKSDPALAVLASESRRLATRAEAARRAFSAATGGDVIQPGSPFYGAAKVADARESPEAMADWAVSRAWGEALEALTSDPDATLPMP